MAPTKATRSNHRMRHGRVVGCPIPLPALSKSTICFQKSRANCGSGRDPRPSRFAHLGSQVPEIAVNVRRHRFRRKLSGEPQTGPICSDQSMARELVVTLSRSPVRRMRSGHVLPVVLLVLLGLALATVAHQQLAVSELRTAQARHHRQRALAHAESAAAAYVHQWNVGFEPSTSTNTPSFHDLDRVSPGAPDTSDRFRQEWARFPDRFPRLAAPGIRAREGFTVGHRVVPGGIAVIAFGWCNGAVRGVRWTLRPAGIFELGAAYGVDPYTDSNPGPGNDRGPALRITGNSALVGRSGAEGRIDSGGSAAFYDGPLVLRAAGTQVNTDFAPIPRSSTPGDPPRTTATGTLANPFLRSHPASASLPDFDTVARQRLANRGVAATPTPRDALLTANDSRALVRVLVRLAKSGHPDFGKVRELGPAPASGTVDEPVLDLRRPSSTVLRSLGMRETEEFAGFRLLPGDHVATAVLQDITDNAPVLIRNHADSETGTGPDGTPWVVMSDPAFRTPSRHPDHSRATESIVRLWLLPPKQPNNPAVLLQRAWILEKPDNPFGFRIYSAHPAGISISGNASFRGALYALATEPIGSGSVPRSFGMVDLQGIVEWVGAVVAWNLSVGGGAVLREAPHSSLTMGDESISRWIPVDYEVLP